VTGWPVPAVGAVRLVRDFVNTSEPQVGAEELTTPEQLREWLAQRQLLPAGARLRPADLATAVTVREGLRAVLRTHAGHPADPAALTALNQALAPVRPVFTADGYHLTAAGGPAFDRALAGLIDAVRQAAEDGTWTRLKVCERDTCRWAFYDDSRNRVRRWCSMAGCGNHVKMRRAYTVRTRRRQGTQDAAPPAT
jgi:predicted RNA-binding Zn ribbon-like protein